MNRDAAQRIGIYIFAIVFILIVWTYAFRAHNWALWNYGMQQRVEDRMREHVDQFHREGETDAETETED